MTGLPAATQQEAWRYRRTAYASGRKEVIGYEKTRFGKPKRKMKQTRRTAVLGHASAMKHKSWRRY